MHFMTDKGENRLHKWLAAHVRGFEMHDRSDWVSHAEASAMINRYEIHIDQHESTTGKPERLVLSRNWFSSK